MSMPSNSNLDADTDPNADMPSRPSVDGTFGMDATPPTANEEREPSAMLLRIAGELFALLDRNALDHTSSLQRNWEQLRQLDAEGELDGGIERVKHDVLRFMVEDGQDTGDEEGMMDALKDCLSDHMDLDLPDPYCSSSDDEPDDSDSVSEDQDDYGGDNGLDNSQEQEQLVAGQGEEADPEDSDDTDSSSDEYLSLRSQASMQSD
ncbi:hypothetical protein D9613_005761 [Agrocybe pediades]|uniref:Uncharacterized protein n=1 Tax=Agrocybe pediades TaxID=84607 RepID=A0A8H4QV30_9AGAR|nr:hypothetical protein D9613_005761 [Agrocybe pediades]